MFISAFKVKFNSKTSIQIDSNWRFKEMSRFESAIIFTIFIYL